MIRVAEECEGMMCLIELVIIAGEVELVYSLLLPSPSGTDLCLCVVYRKCSLQFSEPKDCSRHCGAGDFGNLDLYIDNS